MLSMHTSCACRRQPGNWSISIFLTHVFHHIPDVSLFLKEAERVLVPGGFVGMIDVAATPFARFFFSNFHPEPFSPKLDWQFAQNDSMMDSNQALSWIVFERDLMSESALAQRVDFNTRTILRMVCTPATLARIEARA